MSVYLRCKVVLLQLPSLPQIPGADGVIQASSPKLGSIIGDINTARSICVTLELPEGHTCTCEVNKKGTSTVYNPTMQQMNMPQVTLAVSIDHMLANV